MKLAELVGIARPLEVARHGLVQRLAVPPGGPWAGALATIKIVCDAPKNSEAVGSSNANSLCGRNSAGSPEICATFQRHILRRHF